MGIVSSKSGKEIIFFRIISDRKQGVGLGEGSGDIRIKKGSDEKGRV